MRKSYLYKIQASKKFLEQIEAAVEATKAQVQVIQVQLNDTVIRAPLSGTVTQKYATEGAFVTPTTSASSTASATSTSIIAIAKDLESRSPCESPRGRCRTN